MSSEFYGHPDRARRLAGINLKKIAYMIALVAGSTAFAANTLISGERLERNHYLYSENGMFRFGLNDDGACVLEALFVDDGIKSLVDGWDGFTYWTARFTPDPWGRAPKPLSEYKPMDPKDVHNPLYWRLNYATCHGDFMHQHKELAHRDSYQVKGADFLALADKNIHYGLALCKKDPCGSTLVNGGSHILWAACGSAGKEDRILTLQNDGRAVVLTESGKIVWCSCPYCNDWTGVCEDWGSERGIKMDHYSFSGTKFAEHYKGMAAHTSGH